MRFTIFPDKFATEALVYDEPWTRFVEGMREPPIYPNKVAAPYIKLGAFGAIRTEANCLRHDENLRAISGLEGDYDGERIGLEEAAERARRCGLTALFVTTPTHKPDAPRWRVFAPLSREFPPEARELFMDSLNGALGGILTDESWTRSQCFKFGRVEGVEYRAICI